MEEKQKYAIVGRVEIGTDEYRDLIETTKNLEKDLDGIRSRYWNEQSRADKATKRVEVLTKDIEVYKSFINSKPSMLEAYNLFLLTTKNNEPDED